MAQKGGERWISHSPDLWANGRRPGSMRSEQGAAHSDVQGLGPGQDNPMLMHHS